MDFDILLILSQDGLVVGAIYALMALGLVLVFSVTRIILLPQGEFVTYAVLSMALLESEIYSPVIWMLWILVALVWLKEIWKKRNDKIFESKSLVVWALIVPIIATITLMWGDQKNMIIRIITVISLITPLGPLLYRIVFQPIADTSILFLLIVSVALHWVLVGFGLYYFGAEGFRTNELWSRTFDFWGMLISGQAILVIGVTILLLFLVYIFFNKTMLGKALRATADNSIGAQIMAIPTEMAGDLAFAMAAFIGCICGILIGPITTIYYNTGFMIALKGFVAAIIGALSSYPLSVLGSMVVGEIEIFASFWASSFKEVFVFVLIIPVLWWRSRRANNLESDE